MIFWGQFPPLLTLWVIRAGYLLIELDLSRPLGWGLDLFEGVALATDQDAGPPPVLAQAAATRHLEGERRHRRGTLVHLYFTTHYLLSVENEVLLD